MKNTILSSLLACVALGFGLSLAPDASAAQEPVVVETQAAEFDATFDALLVEFLQLDADWSVRLEAADRDGKRALRKARPETAFYGRFHEAGLAGSGRSLAWCVRNVNKSDATREEKAQRQQLHVERLLQLHRDEPWMIEEDVFALLVRQGRLVGDERLEALFLEVGEKAKRMEARALALVTLAGRLALSKDAAARARGEALMVRVERDFPTEALQAVFSGEKFAALFLNVGQIAPDFVARTVDGTSFKLSEFRGKVTLIDFWGFW